MKSPFPVIPAPLLVARLRGGTAYKGQSAMGTDQDDIVVLPLRTL